MNKAAEIFLAMNLDKASTIRRIAAHVACDYWMQMHQHGFFQPYEHALQRICRRFKLGDFILALSAHYPVTNSKQP